MFFPYGKVGWGYVLSEKTAKSVKNFITLIFIIAFATPVSPVQVFGISKYIVSFCFVVTFYIIGMRVLLHGSEKTNEEMKVGSLEERVKKQAVLMGKSSSVMMLIANLILIAASIFILIVSKTPKAKLIGVLGTLFSGLGLLLSVALVKFSFEKKNKV